MLEPSDFRKVDDEVETMIAGPVGAGGPLYQSAQLTARRATHQHLKQAAEQTAHVSVQRIGMLPLIQPPPLSAGLVSQTASVVRPGAGSSGRNTISLDPQEAMRIAMELGQNGSGPAAPATAGPPSRSLVPTQSERTLTPPASSSPASKQSDDLVFKAPFPRPASGLVVPSSVTSSRRLPSAQNTSGFNPYPPRVPSSLNPNSSSAWNTTPVPGPSNPAAGPPARAQPPQIPRLPHTAASLREQLYPSPPESALSTIPPCRPLPDMPLFIVPAPVTAAHIEPYQPERNAEDPFESFMPDVMWDTDSEDEEEHEGGFDNLIAMDR